jgi:hypothetical protein
VRLALCAFPHAAFTWFFKDFVVKAGLSNYYSTPLYLHITQSPTYLYQKESFIAINTKIFFIIFPIIASLFYFC